MAEAETNGILTLTTEIVASFVGNSSHIKAEELPALIRSVRAALSEDATPPALPVSQTPKATKSQVKKSITPAGLISFIDGKTYKILRRHLGANGHSLESYKAAYGLPSDYPSVAPEYSATRSAMAKTLGLGARGRGKTPSNAAAKPATKKKAAASADD